MDTKSNGTFKLNVGTGPSTEIPSTHLYLTFPIVGGNPSATGKQVDIPFWVLWEEIEN